MLAAQESNAFGHDKVARYGWVFTSEKGEFDWIDKRKLNVNNQVYQRDHAKGKVLDMASKWSWISCGVLTVAERDGEYWVVDGQHRKLAADRRSDIKTLPCIVFKVVSIAEEARAFLATNTNRKPVTALGKFKAMVAAGDKNAIAVQQVVDRVGLRFATASKDTGDFKAVRLALELCERDEQAFSDIMRLAGEMAHDERAPVHQRFLAGLSYLNDRIPGGVNDPRLRKRIKQVGLRALLEGADRAAGYYGKGGAKVYADGMLTVINARLHQKYEIGA